MTLRALPLLMVVACAHPSGVRGADAVDVAAVEPRVCEETPAPRAEAYAGPRSDLDRYQGPDLMTVAIEEGSGIPLASVGVDIDGVARAFADAAKSIEQCPVAGEQLGHGRVAMVFDGTGHSRSVELEEGPYRGTATGACLLTIYGAVTVPSFLGPPVRVGKTFSLP